MDADRIRGQNALLNLILLSLAGVGGYFWLSGPLDSSRPATPPAHGHPALKAEDVDARLWQDPFATTSNHNALEAEHLPAHAETVHGLANFQNQVQRQMVPSGGHETALLVMPVMVRGESSAEDEELRLRSRYAVVTALGVAGYVPSDSGHIGFVELFQWQEAGTMGRWDGSKCSENDATRHPLLVPYEWFEPDPLTVAGQIADSVLVLWLADEAFADSPLVRLTRLLGLILNDDTSMNQFGSEVRIEVVGPAGSPSLRAMKEDQVTLRQTLSDGISGAEVVNELFSVDPPCAPVAASFSRWAVETLRHVTIHSPWATAPEELILSSLSAPMPTELNDRLKLGPTYVPAIGTDDQTILALIRELCLRGVDARKDPIALVTESDTFYGRALPTVFSAAVQCLSAKSRPTATCPAAREYSCPCDGEAYQRLDRLIADCERDLGRYYDSSDANAVDRPTNIYAFSYLRGVDGLVPGSRASDAASGNRDKDNKAVGRRLRRPEGPAQYDFLRRMEWMSTLKKFGTAQRCGIGVLGSDVYDKLVLLQALRERFSSPLYFTTDLDARLAHPDELAHTRNLIVASYYGLEPPKEVAKAYEPRRVAPFRDTYQTAVFVACLQAMEKLPKKPHEAAGVHVYEIGRNGPVEMTNRDTQPRPSSDVLRNVILAVALFAVLPIPILLSWSPKGRLKLNPWEALTLVLGLVALIWLASEIYHDQYRRTGEPWTVLAGVSVWPTTVLRLMAGILAVWFVVRSHTQLGRTEREGIVPHGNPLSSRPRASVPSNAGKADTPGRHQDGGRASRTSVRPLDTGGLMRLFIWRKKFSICKWVAPVLPEGPGREEEVDVESLWDGYRMRSRLRYRLARFIVPVVLYIAFASALVQILPAPSAPFRGTASERLGRAALFISVIAMLILIFYIVDATRLCARFVDLLASYPSRWPSGALTDPGTGDPPRCVLRHRGVRAAGPAEEPYCREWLDIKAIGAHTDTVGRLIYYPVIVILIMLLARTPYLDNWGFPTAIMLLIAINFSYAVICALLLRRAAESARRVATQRLADSRMTADGAQAGRIEFAIRRIESFRRGAFAPLSQQPVIQALLLPSGGFGAWALIEYLVSA